MAMRVQLQWFISAFIILFVLVYMMFSHYELMSKGQNLIRSLTSNTYTTSNFQQPPVNSVKVPQSFGGAFEEKREKVLSAQDFHPQTIVQNRDPNFDYKKAMKELIASKVQADDPRLIQLLHDYYILPPSTLPYNLDNPNRLEYSKGQTPFIDSRLNYIEGGFYVECGGLNGEKGSNTLFFEKVRKWNGLVIEADPGTFEALKSKNRKAFISNACLSPISTPAKLTFNKAYNRGRIMHDKDSRKWIKKLGIKPDPVEIECFPLYSFMLALNRTTIDFFSLDVEGDELNVLRTVPFDKLNIKMLTVEYIHERGGHGQLQRFMESKGYSTLLKMQRANDNGVNDLIFRKRGLSH